LASAYSPGCAIAFLANASLGAKWRFSSDIFVLQQFGYLLDIMPQNTVLIFRSFGLVEDSL
jgi:hypothetical protein